MPRTKQHDRQYILLDDGQQAVTAAEVVAYLRDGSTVDAQANRLDVSSSHLRQWLARNGYHAVKQTTWQQQGDA
jgi:transposase